MPEVITIGELLVEVMRKDVDVPLDESAEFVGPFPSGAPGIFIDAVARLGMSSGIVGGVGEDDFGNCIIQRLEEDGVNTSEIERNDDLSTGVAFVSYSSDGSRSFIFHMGNSAAGDIESDEISKDYIESASAIHVSGASLMMGEKMREACYRVVKEGKEAGAIICFDPNVRSELMSPEKTREILDPVLKRSDLLTPGVDELKGVLGVENEKRGAEELINNGVKLVAVKDSDEGCRIYTENEEIESQAFDVEEVDPTGAGDAFSAGIIVGWLEEMDLKELARFANAVGAKAVTKKGPMEGVAWREEIKEMLEGHK